MHFFNSDITSVNILLEHFFGPGDDESKFITGMINKMKSNVPEIELTAGTQIRDFIFIEDVLDAYFVVIKNIETFIGYVNLPLGSGQGITIREIVEFIRELSQSSSVLKFGAVKMRDNELMKSDADISMLNKLGWNPKYNLIEGLKLTLS
jgi:CDP-paratose synthetase